MPVFITLLPHDVGDKLSVRTHNSFAMIVKGIGREKDSEWVLTHVIRYIIIPAVTYSSQVELDALTER